MKRILTRVVCLCAIAASSRLAHAQRSDSLPSPGTLSNPEGDVGVQLSGSSVLHVGITTEAGYDTNVFYSDQNPVASAVLRITPSLQMTNAPREQGMPTPPILYDFNALLTYREYLSDNENVRAQRAFNPSVNGSLTFSGTSVGMTVADSFARTEDAPYVETQSEHITRDYNQASAIFRIAPGGGRIEIAPRYVNRLDYYENASLKYASNMAHEGALDLSWKWLPKTAIYLQGGVIFTDYLQSDTSVMPRQNSIAYRGLLGLRGLVTAKVSSNIYAGYSNASYDGGIPGPSGADSLAAGLDINYQPTVFTRLGLSYAHGFRNSPVIGSFYGFDSAGLAVAQSFASKLVLTLTGRYEFRRYHDILVMGGGYGSRNDNVVLGGAQLDYFLTRWFYAGVLYSILANQTVKSSLTSGVMGIDYVKQQVFGRIGIIY